MIINGQALSHDDMCITTTFVARVPRLSDRRVVRTGCRFHGKRWRQWCWFAPYAWSGCVGRVMP